MLKKFFKILEFIQHHPLAGRHKWQAFKKFTAWQIAQKLVPYPVEYPFLGNTKLILKKGMTGGTGNIYSGLHEFYEMAFLLHFLRKEDVFADVGANIGSYTVLSAGYIGAFTWAFEPVPATFSLLEKNVAVNGIGEQTMILNCGIGSANARVSFTNDQDTINHVVLSTEGRSNVVEVDIKSLDTVFAGSKIPSLLKIDVEGFEQEVINGAGNVLDDDHLKAIIIELNGSGGRYNFSEEKIHQQLLGKNFVPHLYDPFKRVITEVKDFGKHNTIYLRDMPFVVERIKTGNPFLLFNESI